MRDFEPSSHNQARHCAMDYLARREHACLELKNKLIRKGFIENVVDEVLSKLRTDRLLSDERFAESYIRYRTKKGFGPIRIKQELRQRGITGDLVSEQLNGNEDFWITQVQQVYKKKFGSNSPKNDKELAKHMRFLQTRGFTSSQIKTVF
ncbi:regulatory protein RecX [Candidatus Halobeggiatoa sp. HSG11]|nr:regulatory protein RecX [Candidatus Halobeggiatoa sp. HSG11]